MKVTLTTSEDVKCIDWLAVADQIVWHARKKISDVMLQAGSELKNLKPGESKRFVIEIGTVEISREADNEQTDRGQGPIPSALVTEPESVDKKS